MQILKICNNLVYDIWYKASLPFIAKINVHQKITCYIREAAEIWLYYIHQQNNNYFDYLIIKIIEKNIYIEKFI